MEENDTTTMKISRGLLDKLEKIKEHPRVPNEEIVERMINFYNKYKGVVIKKWLLWKVIPDKFSSKENATVTIIQFELSGEKHILYTRSAVLTKQLAVMKDGSKLPFTAKIVKQKKYLTFV